MPNLIQHYRKEIIPALNKEFKIGNVMAVPKITKVVINVGVGRITKDDKAIERIVKDITMISGQKPVIRSAKKSIASFKIRQGVPVGVSVTLRGKRMYDFVDRFIHISLPGSKDFRGIQTTNIDQSGNLNVGLRESSIFPELSYENTKDIFGLQVTITTNARTHERGVALLKHFGFPLTDKK